MVSTVLNWKVYGPSSRESAAFFRISAGGVFGVGVDLRPAMSPAMPQPVKAISKGGRSHRREPWNLHDHLRAAEVITEDGPFMSSTLPVAGFAIIEAATLAEAIDIVSHTPWRRRAWRCRGMPVAGVADIARPLIGN